LLPQFFLPPLSELALYQFDSNRRSGWKFQDYFLEAALYSVHDQLAGFHDGLGWSGNFCSTLYHQT